jgi:curved DNA-binding protein CbpA
VTPENDYYGVLGVPPDASPDEIRKAFRERVRACHPDRVANLDEDLRRLAEEKMVQLNEAFAVLRNPARRAAYDDRHGKQPGAVTATAHEAAAAVAPGSAGPSAHSTGRARDALSSPGAARNRIGEQQFVARAATEEFEHAVKRSVSGRVAWTPVAFRGATTALHGQRGRSNLYFVLLAAPQLDDKQVQRFLRALEGFGTKLQSRIFGYDRLYGFAGAVEFTHRQRQKSALERFNRSRRAKDPIQPATFIDLVNWHVVPGETSLQARLDSLLRSS